VIGDHERALGHERDNGNTQPAIAPPRKSTPPDIDDRAEKRHSD
jgi:hypothetical protein